jgi:hypothetical protein
LIVTLGYYLLVVVPLFFTGVIGHLNSFFLFLDKLSIGIIIGSFVFWGVSEWYLYMKKENGGHSYFPFQKVAMPVGVLAIMSLIFYLLLK